MHSRVAKMSTPGRSAATRTRSSRRGAATVEFALVAPIIFLFIFGAIELARLNMVRHAVANAAYESARYGMVPGATSSEIADYALGHLGVLGIKGATVSVTPDPVVEETQFITVDVIVPIDQNSWVVPRFAAGKQLHSTCTLRTERYFGF